MRSLLLAVAVLGVFLAALAKPSQVTAHITNCVLYLSILAALPGIVYRRGAVRAFWIGVALFGWGQLVLERVTMMGGRGSVYTPPLLFMYGLFFGPDPPPPYATYFPPASSSTYPVPGSIGIVQPDQSGDVLTVSPAPAPYGPSVTSGYTGYTVMAMPAPPGPRQDNFLSVGTAMLTTILTCLGGLLSDYLYRTQQQPSPPSH